MTAADRVMDERESSNHSIFWYPVVPLLVLALIVTLYFDTTLSVIREWSESGAYSHGLLAFAMSALLIHGNRYFLADARKSGQTLAMLATLGFGFVWLMGHLSETQFLQQFALVAIFNTSFASIYGWRTYRVALLFPLGTLFLAAPVWNFLSSQLQDLSTHVASTIVAHLGIPVLREDHTIVVPGGQFVVEEGCSGLGFLLTSGLISLYVIYLNGLRTRSAVMFTIFAASIAILSNWIRITIIILIGNATNMQAPLVSNHLVFGWILFSLAILPMIYVGHRLAPPGFSRPVKPPEGDQFNQHKLILPLLALVVFPLVSLALDSAGKLGNTSYELRPPATLAGYQTLPMPNTRWNPVYRGADSTHFAAYRDQQQTYLVATANYQSQKQDKELIYYANSPFDPALTQPLYSGSEDGFNYVVVRDRDETERLIAYWYIVCGQQTTSEYVAKARRAYCRITGQDGASAVLVSTSLHAAKNVPDQGTLAFISALKASIVSEIEGQ